MHEPWSFDLLTSFTTSPNHTPRHQAEQRFRLAGKVLSWRFIVFGEIKQETNRFYCVQNFCHVAADQLDETIRTGIFTRVCEAQRNGYVGVGVQSLWDGFRRFLGIPWQVRQVLFKTADGRGTRESGYGNNFYFVFTSVLTIFDTNFSFHSAKT